MTTPNKISGSGKYLDAAIRLALVMWKYVVEGGKLKICPTFLSKDRRNTADSGKIDKCVMSLGKSKQLRKWAEKEVAHSALQVGDAQTAGVKMGRFERIVCELDVEKQSEWSGS